MTSIPKINSNAIQNLSFDQEAIVKHLHLGNKKMPMVMCDNKPERIFVFNCGMRQLLSIADIIMIQSNSNYSTIYLLGGKKILTSKTLKYWEEKLHNGELFLRSHMSFLINKHHIEHIDVKTNRIILKGQLCAFISRREKAFVLNNLSIK
jgi:two-component system, LytTR family, response regulator